MKKNILFTLLLSLSLIASQSMAADPGFEIKIQVKGLKDTVVYWGNHFGDKQYVSDTLKVNSEGWAIHKGKEEMTGGIYLVVLPNKTYFEVLINKGDQHFTVQTDTLDYIKNMKITGSLENKIFNEHQLFIIDKSTRSQDLKARLDNNKSNKDSTAYLKKELSALDKEVKEFRLNMLKKDPNTFMSKIIMTMQEPDVPEPPKDEKGNILDSLFQFNYYKAHFLENVDFSDERLLRTPILQGKIKTYTQQLTVPYPDSIIVSVDTIIQKSKANKEVFKYCVANLANFYETSNIMGYDKVFVHIAENYYLTKDAFWADSTLKAKIHERVMKIKPNILGNVAYNMIMPDTSLNIRALHDIKTKYTVIVFWDPTCSHCKHEVPLLSQYYDSVKTKGVSIEVFAVGIESDIELWKKFIKDNKLKWINVSDLYNNTNFRNYYDIYSTPVIYLLDDKKRIIAKRLDTEKVRDFIANEEKRNKK